VLICGDTGCGKTHLVQHVLAALLKLTFNTLVGEEGNRDEDIVGYADLKEENGASVRTFVEGILPVSMTTPDCVMYWDELSRSPAGIQSICFDAMDDRRQITLTQDNRRVIKAWDGFVVIASQNEGIIYRGASQIDAATRSRFGAIIDLGYLPEAKEKKLLVDRTGIDAQTAGKMAMAARQLRATAERGEISTPISTRNLIDACDGVRMGVDLHAAITVSIVNQAPATDSAQRKTIADVFEAHFGKSGGAK